MVLPQTNELLLPLLKVIENKEEYKVQEIIDEVVDTLELSEEDLNEKMPNKEPVISSRISTANMRLKKAELVELKRFGYYSITEKGRDFLSTNPDELSGLKIRVIGSDTCINMMNNMGGVGQGMPQGDVYSAIQTKVLDGAENNIITYVDLVQYEVAPYYNYSGHLLLPDELVISNEVLESMSEEDQAALRKVCQESIPYCFNLCDELRSDYQAKAEEKGVTFSECDIPAFQALCQDLIQENAAKSDVTQGMYDLIMSLRETE